MKFLGLYLILGGVLLAPMARAQDAKTLSVSKFTQGNLKAAALMGGFFDSLQHASTYRGVFVLKKIANKNTDAEIEHNLQWESAWVSDGKGTLQKLNVDATYTVVTQGISTVESFQIRDDGEKVRKYFPAKGIWSEKAHDAQTSDLTISLATNAWKDLLTKINAGADFRLSPAISSDGRKYIAMLDGEGTIGYFNTDSRKLELWSPSNSTNSANSDLRWFDCDLNVPITDSTWKWTPPVNARQVSPTETEWKLEF